MSVEPVELPKWAVAFLTELPATSERVADLFGLDDVAAAVGLTHLGAANWALPLAGRGSLVWYPVGPAIAADTSRPIAVRVIAILPATLRQLREALPDLTGRQISGALNTQRSAKRAFQTGETWHTQIVVA